MSVTLAQARTALRERLDEKEARAWDDHALDRWLQEGAKDIARRCEVLQATTTIAVTASTQTYDAPTNMVRIYRVTWSATGDSSVYPLEYRDFNSADAVWWTQSAVSTGVPTLFTMWGVPGSVDITLYPTPSQNGTLTVQYYRLPTAPTLDSSTMDLPEGWEDTMYSYAEYKAMLADRDDRWQAAKAIYEEQLEDLHGLTRRHTDQGGSSWQPDLPASNAWLYNLSGDW